MPAAPPPPRRVADVQQQQHQPSGVAGATTADGRARLVAGAAAAGAASGSSISSGSSIHSNSISTSSSRHALESSAAPLQAGVPLLASSQQQQGGGGGGGARSGAGAHARYVRATLLLCLLLLSAGVAQYLDATQLELLIESLRGAPLASMLVFVVLFATAVVLLVPGMLLSIGSGAAFGLASGALVAWLGTVLGQVGAFLLARYLLRDMVVGFLESRLSRFREIDAGVSNDGWKLVLLLRLSPVLPYNLMNYALGVTAIGLWPYTLASGAAAVPYVCLFAYLGSVSSDLYKLLHDGARAYLTPQLLIGLACLMILSAVGLVHVCRHALGGTHAGGCSSGPDGDQMDEGDDSGGYGARPAQLQAAEEGRSLLPMTTRDAIQQGGV